MKQMINKNTENNKCISQMVIVVNNTPQIITLQIHQ